MSDVKPWYGDRPLPEFFLTWRKQWLPGGPSFTPSDYLNQDAAVPFVIAAAWLFCPETTEYRGGIFLSERFDAANADTWIGQFKGDLQGAEMMVNTITLYDFFVGADLDPYSGQELMQLAEMVGDCWRGVLSLRYPERELTVRVLGEADGQYSPNITFWTGPKEG